MNIGVIFGGRSVEHDISIITGLQVINGLDKNKYNIVPIYLSKDNYIYCNKKYKKLENIKKISTKIGANSFIKKMRGIASGQSLRKLQKKKKIDLIFNCTHGAGAEDGIVSGMLEFINIPYTSSNILSSSIAQDKDMTKKVLSTIGIPLLDHIVIKHKDKRNILEMTKDINYPVIIKPAHLGSSIGIYIASCKEELLERVKQAFIYDDKIIIEKLLQNFQEFSIAIYKRKNEYHLSKVEVLNRNHDIFSFEEKYINHHKEVTHIYLSNDQLEKELKDYTIKGYELLEMNGIVRFDYLYCDNNLYLNEINTIPGGLSNYLFKDQISFKLLLDEQIREALYMHKKKNELLKSYESNVLKNNNISFKK